LAMRSWNLRILHFWQMSTKNARFWLFAKCPWSLS
jgi:hypothetical protein